LSLLTDKLRNIPRTSGENSSNDTVDSSSSGRNLKTKIVRALRWLEIKEVFGWEAICLGDLFPPTWFNREKSSDQLWSSSILEILKENGDALKCLWKSILVRTLGQPFIPDEPDHTGVNFFSWIAKLGPPRSTQFNTLETVVFIAARIYTSQGSLVDGKSTCTASYISASIQASLHSQPDLTWPHIGQEARRLIKCFFLDAPILTNYLNGTNIELGPLILQSVDQVIETLLPVRFLSFYRYHCAKCGEKWESPKVELTHMEWSSPFEVSPAFNLI
jgi:hypothetical protein